MIWVKIVAWHAFRTYSRANRIVTLCGRVAPEGATVVDALPGGASCETCLRLYARRADAPETPVASGAERP